MGTIGARQAREILENTKNIQAIEIMISIQGIDFLAPLKPGVGTRVAYRFLRSIVPHLDSDRMLAPDIAKIRDTITSGSLVNAVESGLGRWRNRWHSCAYP